MAVLEMEEGRMQVCRDGAPIYDIVLEDSFDRLPEEMERLGSQGRKLCIVTDSNVAPLYLEAVEKLLSGCFSQVTSYVFPAGEEHKNLDTVKRVYEHLIQNRFDRKDWLAALGGGVTGDLCGFTAATYLRGVDFIQIPTTLLSQVDSSIGGKTGVDFDAYKNMVGAFHMPQLVYTAATSLLTLTEEQFACGMGEVIKHGLIMDADYYEWLQAHRKEILARDLSVCEQMILVSCRVKRDVVEQDPTEQGIRGILNFGHTLGHAIEKLMHFQLLHGQCVALGCVAAAGLSAKRGEITMEEALHIREVFADFGLPTAIADFGLSREEIIPATKNDKKMDSGRIKFILLHRVGEAFIDRTVTDEEMNTCLDWLMGGSDEDERI